ncbi:MULTISPECIES: MurR/RpiR family transcriptional regulator [Liquorilactobacillus]|uniref:RpiR family transcriptional regulator n=1 Tax=Liquorilactobacillus nagelii TaxID=82688 RepID=A0A3S6QV26_9LACO|nr:MurR/RpiR family transcriptional regulator [Liquorilactobacillus nagelii]AUJ31996.1 RpiR family transcriptional regulator [Liquorilactobacillus nagelii]MCC7615141.1 RpiR family transcriptional regulator [Liquorilactobacillus nagelii]MCP9314805.1 MurR/RpiR family transcriptional regulator [Liquorilactobacillus nagelii]
MSVKGKLLNLATSLSNSEKKVADYILLNSDKVVSMTVAQLATAACSSPAAVIRLIKHLEIASFTSMKVSLAAELSHEKANNNFYADIKANESLAEIKNKLLGNAQRTLQETSDQIEENAVKQLTNQLIASEQILLFGIGASALVAEDISQKWSRLGYSITVDNDLNLLLPKLVRVRPQTILWIISNSGESPESLVAAKTAHKLGIKVVSLTRFGQNELNQVADIGIHTSQPPEDRQRIAATSSLLAQFMVVDLIFYYFVSQHFDYFVKTLDLSRQVIKDYHVKFGFTDK